MKNLNKVVQSDIISSKSTIADTLSFKTDLDVETIAVKTALPLFDFMSFARLLCNNKTCVLENKLLDSSDVVIAALKNTKKVDFTQKFNNE